MAILSHFELELLWVNNGGDRFAADTAAAVAQAESRGRTDAFNDTPSTGDLSYGLWQINYFGVLKAPRTAAFGPGPGLFNPDKNARAAVSISNGGRKFTDWTMYRNGAYKKFLTGALPPSPGDSPKVTPGAAGDLQPLTRAWHLLTTSWAYHNPRKLDQVRTIRRGLRQLGK